MGCDIHAHIELKIGGIWHHYSCPPLQRCYSLFARIADVRNYDKEIEPIAQPRGLPHDVSAVTRAIYEWEKADAHSMTWLGRDELNDLIEWHEKQIEAVRPGYGYTAQHEQWGYLNGNCFLKHPESHPSCFEDCRLVCWFDN